MTKGISLDQPLLEQAAVREILFPQKEGKEGLIPNLMLERILEITRILVQNELNQKFSSYELANLVVGYDVFTEDENGEIPEQIPQRFSVEWKHEALKKSVVINPDSLIIEFLDVLLLSLQEIFKEFIPQSFKDKAVHACLLVSLVQENHIDEVLSTGSLMLSEDASPNKLRSLPSSTLTSRFTHEGACNCYDRKKNQRFYKNSDGTCPKPGQGKVCNPSRRKGGDERKI